jgi:hypothetical protein
MKILKRRETSFKRKIKFVKILKDERIKILKNLTLFFFRICALLFTIIIIIKLSMMPKYIKLL